MDFSFIRSEPSADLRYPDIRRTNKPPRYGFLARRPATAARSHERAGARVDTRFVHGVRVFFTIRRQIPAHDPARYQKAGRMVAAAGSRPFAQTEAAYRQIFAEALASDATRGRNVNAMHRAFRQIGERLDDSLRLTMLDRIHAYERGELPLDVPIVLLSRHAVGERLRWTAQQTYLNPFPGDLRRRLWPAEADSAN
jgi:uncharacterized protein YbgA (DUF1722 family)